MNLSHKLTFSLASVFLLLAFAVMPVLAHDPPTGQTFEEAHDGVRNSDTQDATEFAAETGHSHLPQPAAPTITLVDLKAADDASTAKDGTVLIVNDVTASPVVLTDLTGANDGQFQVKIMFSEPVYSASAAGTTAGSTDLAVDDLTVTAAKRSASGTNIFVSGSIGISSIVRMDDDAATTDVNENLNTFIATFTVDGDLFHDGTDPIAGSFPMDIWITVKEDVLFSLDGTLVDGVEQSGRGNMASMRAKFSVVDELMEEETRDTTKPTLMITHSPADEAMLPASGNVTFTFTFSEALGSNDNGFSLSDVTIENGSVVDFGGSGMEYTLEVKPTDPMMDVKVTVAANAVADGDGNNLAADVMETYMADDTENPTVVITSVKGTGDDAGKIIVTFTFSEELMAETFTSEDIDRTQTNVLLDGEPMKSSTDPKVYTVKVTPPATGSATIVLKTGSVEDMQGNKLQGDQSHTYTPTPAETAATITAPADTANAGNTAAGATVTVTFSKDPGTVTAMIGTTAATVTGTGTSRMIMIPAGQATGSVAIALTWALNGSGTVTYTIPASAEPTMPTNIMKVNIPANSFVVLVRAMNQNVAALNFPTVPPVGGTAVDVRVWAAMPDLHDLFRRSAQSPGGALVLRMSADDAAADRPALGTVGISEIMSGRDLGKATPTAQAAGQWIELQNLNDKAVNVLIYAQKGSDGLISNGQLVNTAAGDNLLGNPGGMIVDAIQNIRNDGNSNAGGWNVKGKEGNSLTGLPFASMNRILPDKKSKYENADGSRFNNRKGTNGGHWAESGDVYLRGQTAATPPVLFDYRGTPGAVNNVPSVTIITKKGRDFKPASNTIVINEVANRSNNAYDWIELRNVSGSEINLKNYLITILRGSGDNNPAEKVLVRFPANDNAKVAAGAVFLLLNTDPAGDSNHPIAATGYNVDKSLEEQQPGTPNSPVRYKVFSSLVLPNDDGGKFVLMVRKPDSGHNNGPGQHKDQGTSETGSTAHGPDLHHIVDIAGYDDNLGKNGYPNAVSSTNIWPLYDFAAPRSNKNTFKPDTVLQRNRLTTKHDLGGTGIEGDDGNKPAFGTRGWTGVGYRRLAATTNANGGTPGYPNGALHGAGTTITTAVYISEIMYADAGNDALPQWIELRNPSNSVGADLNNWRLTIINHADKEVFGDGKWRLEAKGRVLERSVLLRGLKIKPNGAVLITSRTGPRSDVHLDDSEIFSLFPSRRNDFGMQNANSDVINPFGFKITLNANGHEGDRNKWQLVDEVGNLAALDATDRRGDNEHFDMPRWMWPDGNDADGARISVTRANSKFDHGSLTTANPQSVLTDLSDGTKKNSWILSDMDSRTTLIDNVYYGSVGDTSTPGQTFGQPLPVELSFFRPTLENGQVTIQWTTESELDNAGFNILRSDTRNGEFTQVNEQMIQGKGTTAERSTYKWVDTTAKPGVVYYYQIEDVSYAGEHTKLATTKLKGLISAKGKLTTQWGELKNLR